MASEEAERAVITKAVAVRARDLVRALLAPGGLVSVEDAGETVAVSVRSCVAKTSPENLAVRRQDVEKLAVAAATASLTVIVNVGLSWITDRTPQHGRGGNHQGSCGFPCPGGRHEDLLGLHFCSLVLGCDFLLRGGTACCSS
ncbi:uncharacterized protein LOC120662868 isoform X1 [Panicum virgatum]|uniref:uncharacterized protein LOC120662868 isoform X1 n=1 Tax=Panicum virgatum TaxID=38727 RepID=UPI0019D6835D|nr:uncharacterized protein LOC120662868 isoform X1 [Panicum virgatum]